MTRLVLLRHGQSVWNRENRFTGWTDVDLTEEGRAEARRAGELLMEAGFAFDVAYTSLLKRAIRTLWLAMDEMDRMWVPVVRDWRLNERHYGALEGLNKAETAARHGDEQALRWRRSFATRPPPMGPSDAHLQVGDPRYAGLRRDQLPLVENLGDTARRTLALWRDEIAPEVARGRQVIVVAHSNSLRALVMHLDRVPEQEILSFDFPTGVPLLYDLDDQLRPRGRRFLGDGGKSEPALHGAAARAGSRR